ncbi:phage exclusion protein Lit family protein [Agriterribacter sp.]|uniref:phage exclusion protein Lit family protein n=1 Tax=Agriterribacter sp. TaxID=2821509 RepID=UPI002C59F7E1|nr:phage exclusion protein Lit family protein [Agriterribacter sp.]HTN05711.1 phage exclusion protein Lit family protein [Agriterribacter sp.]
MPAIKVIDKSNPSHIGLQPIRVLQDLLPLKLENTCPGFIELTRDAIENKNLYPGLIYHYGNKRAESPYVQFSAIHIHESFLSYTWCICYCLYALHTETFNVKNGKTDDAADESINEILNLFRYAKSLIHEYSEWNKEKFPNPELYGDEEKMTIEIVNKLFFAAINYILCHEFAHIECEHNTKHDFDDPDFNINAEIEADERALQLMLLGCTSTTLQGTSLGIICAVFSYFFFSKYTVSSNGTHPDTDNRLHEVLLYLDPEPNSPIWAFAYIGYRLWDMAFNKNFEEPETATSNKELYFHIYEQLQNEKKTL